MKRHITKGMRGWHVRLFDGRRGVVMSPLGCDWDRCEHHECVGVKLDGNKWAFYIDGDDIYAAHRDPNKLPDSPGWDRFNPDLSSPKDSIITSQRRTS